MVNRSLFLRLCKTLLAVACFAASPCFSFAQISVNAPTQPSIANASFGAPAEKLKIAGVPNAGKISDVLFRGAQPSPQGLVELKKMGVTTIVDLRGNRGPQKVFVHCYYGRDRTGVMVAAYRMAQQHWTPDQAVAEMDSFGFHYHLYPAMKSYVRRFPIPFGADTTFAPLRPASSAPR